MCFRGSCEETWGPLRSFRAPSRRLWAPVRSFGTFCGDLGFPSGNVEPSEGLERDGGGVGMSLREFEEEFGAA